MTNDKRILRKYSDIKDLCVKLLDSEIGSRPSSQSILGVFKNLTIGRNKIEEELRNLSIKLIANENSDNLGNLKFHEKFLLNESIKCNVLND